MSKEPTPIHQVAEAQVTQADREAAAAWAWTFIDDNGRTTGEWLIYLIQAFARHRLTTETRIAELEAALRPFARVAERYDFYIAEAMPRVYLDESDFRRAARTLGDSRHGEARR